MNTADQYLMKAVQLAAQARDPAHASVRDELLRMSHGYLRLAEQADRNSHTDITYETASFWPVALRRMA